MARKACYELIDIEKKSSRRKTLILKNNLEFTQNLKKYWKKSIKNHWKQFLNMIRIGSKTTGITSKNH